jgi:hypothetical protein
VVRFLVRRAAVAAALLVAVPASAAAATPPGIADVSVSKRTAHLVQVSAGVNPNGAVTEARLEFGVTPSLGARTSPATVPAGSEPVLVVMTLNDLKPRTTYYYRFTATNEAGTTTSEIATVTTPARDTAPAGPRVLGPVALSFAVETHRTGPTLGRILGVTRPRGLPAGTSVTVRCHAACHGGRSFTLAAKPRDGTVPINPGIRITGKSVVEIRAVKKGYVGRVRRYVFFRSGLLISARRVLSSCLSAKPPRRVIRCPG